MAALLSYALEMSAPISTLRRPGSQSAAIVGVVETDYVRGADELPPLQQLLASAAGARMFGPSRSRSGRPSSAAHTASVRMYLEERAASSSVASPPGQEGPRRAG